MKRVLILCEDREAAVIKRQLYDNPLNDCLFVFDRNDDYDYLVVLDGFTCPVDVKIDKQHRLIFFGETPYVRRYNKGFINQFGGIYGCDKKGLYKGCQHMMEVFPWFVGRNYNKEKGIWEVTKSFKELESFDNQSRKKKICLLTSDKKFTVGHRNRVRFVEFLKKYYHDCEIDVYGNGYLPFGDKFEVLKDYEYSIVIENSRYPDYFTEKILDCFLMGCYPIYYGCEEICKYFPEQSLTPIDINHPHSAASIITNVIKSQLYKKNRSFIQESKRRVLYDYNLLTVIANIINRNHSGQVTTADYRGVIYPNKQSYWNILSEMISRKTGIII